MVCVLIDGEFWINVLIAFIGAFFGFLSAIGVNKLFEKRNKRKLKTEKENQDKERLSFLLIILKSIITTTGKQVKHYTNWSNTLKKNPLQSCMPVIISSFDLHRLKNLDAIELFDAYNSIIKDSANKISNYKSMFNHGDYLLRLFTDLEIRNERHRNFHHRDELFVRDCIEEIFIKIGLRSKNLQVKYRDQVNLNPEFKYLNSFELIYKSLPKNTDNLIRYRDEYLLPLNYTLLQEVDDINFADELYIIVKRALSRLRNIEFNSTIFAEEITSLNNEIQQSIKYLDEQRIIIEKDIEQ